MSRTHESVYTRNDSVLVDDDGVETWFITGVAVPAPATSYR